MTRHVVFGAGPVGKAVAAALVEQGSSDLVVVSRSGRKVTDGHGTPVPVAAVDVDEPGAARAAVVGADVVYFALNPPHYDRWPVEFPALLAPVLDAARTAGSRLVVMDNLYMLPAVGAPLREDSPATATGSKGRTRAAMEDELLAVSDVEVVLGRASDFFGPGVTDSAFGEWVFRPALTGGPVQLMGDLDQPHSYSYVPDIGRALAALGEPGGPTGILHLPVAPAVTTRELLGLVWDAAGTKRRRVFAAGALGLRAYGLVRPLMRELLETLPQFQHPWVVDDSRFRALFPEVAETPLPAAVRETVAWYRDHPAPARE